MGLAFVPLYIKFLGIEAYALIGLFAVLQAWLSLLDMGMTPALGREMALYTGGGCTTQYIRDLLRSVEVLAVCVALLMAAAVGYMSDWIATSWLTAASLPIAVVTKAFVIMGVVAAVRFLEGVYRSALVGLQRQVLFNGIVAVLATVRSVGVFGVFAWVSPTIEAFFFWQGFASIVTLMLLCMTTYACLPAGGRTGHFSMDAIRNVWRFAGGMLGITFLALLLTQVDKVLLSKLLSLKEFGYYTLAATVAGGLTMLVSPIAQAYYPRFCEFLARAEETALIDAYHKAAQLVSVIVGSAAMVLIFFSETFLYLWSRDIELARHTANILSVLALGTLFNCLMWVPYQMQLAYGWTRLGIYTNTVAVLILVPTIFFVVPQYGAIGAAWVWLALNAGYCIVSVQFMYRQILKSEKWHWYTRDVLAPMGAGMLSAVLIKNIWDIFVGARAQLLELIVATLAFLLSSSLASGYVRRAFRNRFLKDASA